jgi:ribosome-associated protein
LGKHMEIEAERKSKSQKKRDDRALQQLAAELAQLPAAALAGMDLPEELVEALRLAAAITSHGARRRHLLHMGALLRGVDLAPIQAALATFRHGDLEQARVFKMVEHWRDELREGRMEIVEEILARCADAERQRLTQLARRAHAEALGDRGAKASRELFRYLSRVSAPGAIRPDTD